jgi:hypothetical protein
LKELGSNANCCEALNPPGLNEDVKIFRLCRPRYADWDFREEKRAEAELIRKVQCLVASSSFNLGFTLGNLHLGEGSGKPRDGNAARKAEFGVDYMRHHRDRIIQLCPIVRACLDWQPNAVPNWGLQR